MGGSTTNQIKLEPKWESVSPSAGVNRQGG